MSENDNLQDADGKKKLYHQKRLQPNQQKTTQVLLIMRLVKVKTPH